ncbi:MAG TPA: hypothetical protein VGP36_22055 [Mycobacteriales bacterium]|jgi:hypothetical protein|nr:hypothetical protein [Mycobacteriales bacterium]
MQRWSVLALGVAAVVLFGYVVTHRDPVQRPTPPAAAPSTPPGLPRLDGEQARGPDGLRVLVSGRFPQIIDTSIGHSAPVPGLRLDAGERAALQAVPAGTVATVTTPRTSRERTMLLTPTGGAVPLGSEVEVVPVVRGTDLYVAARGPGSTKVTLRSAAGAARLSWTAGGTLTPLRDTTAGLVVSQVGDRQVAELRVLDPRTGASRRRLAVGAIVVASGPDSIATVSVSCVRECPVTVTRYVDGRSVDYATPKDSGNPLTGAFSPDGHWLALGVPGQYRDGRLRVVPGFAEVLDLRSRAVTPVPGVASVAERSADVSWFGPTLVLGVWSNDRGLVGTWSPDDPGQVVRVLPADPPGDEAFATVTALP